MFFDSSADGCIERKELAVALKSGTRVFGRKASKVAILEMEEWDPGLRVRINDG